MQREPTIVRRSIVIPCVALGLAAGLFAAISDAQTHPASAAKAIVYAALGAELTQYDIDVERATLTKRGSVTLPANVQEAAPHPSRRYLYIGWSTTGASYGALSGAPGEAPRHGLTAFRVDAASGALTPHGPSAPLRARPIHLTTDVDGGHVLVAYNLPSGVTVHRLRPDGTIGAEVEQPASLDRGIYAHHVRVLPSNRAVVLVTRGNAPTATTPEDPGALKVFAYSDAMLTNRASIAPGRGYGFQARHIDFHPSHPWAYLTLERQNEVAVFGIVNESLSPAPLFVKTTLAEPGNVRPGQTTSTIHVHPNGRFVYVGNRASATTEFQGTRVSAGGENTIAVFAIDQTSGEPTLIQTVDTRGFQPRTFALDAGGRVLVVGNQNPLAVRDGSRVRTVPAGLSVFRIGGDGRLTFARTYEVDTQPDAGRLLFWMGIAPLN
ncbi:MAG: beta-propeller fold lactonase family protein [Acidobacteria bacterium]|nr:beta-propeller fold lactonase family protein [Acidobacteriota bacterium]